jgi:streptogramin lyase
LKLVREALLAKHHVLLALSLTAGMTGLGSCTAGPGSPAPAALGEARGPAGAHGSWQVFADEGSLEGIVRVKRDYWIANGDGSEDLSHVTPAGKITLVDVDYVPLEITSDASGNLWFTNARYLEIISRFDPATSRVTTYHLNDSSDGGIILGRDGNVWFLENDHIGKLTPQGTLTEYPTPQTEGGTGLAWASDGRIWFSSAAIPGLSWVLTSFDPQSGRVKGHREPTVALGGIVAAPDGTLWYGLSAGTASLVHFDPRTEAIASFPIPGHFDLSPCPAGLQLAPDGSLWYASQHLRGRGYEKHVVGGGFVRFDPGAKQFTTYVSPKGNEWNCELTLAAAGKVWGTSAGAVVVLDPH